MKNNKIIFCLVVFILFLGVGINPVFAECYDSVTEKRLDGLSKEIVTIKERFDAIQPEDPTIKDDLLKKYKALKLEFEEIENCRQMSVSDRDNLILEEKLSNFFEKWISFRTDFDVFVANAKIDHALNHTSEKLDKIYLKLSSIFSCCKYSDIGVSVDTSIFSGNRLKTALILNGKKNNTKLNNSINLGGQGNNIKINSSSKVTVNGHNITNSSVSITDNILQINGEVIDLKGEGNNISINNRVIGGSETLVVNADNKNVYTKGDTNHITTAKSKAGNKFNTSTATTGDDSNPVPFFALAAACAIAFGGAFMGYKKFKK